MLMHIPDGPEESSDQSGSTFRISAIATSLLMYREQHESLESVLYLEGLGQGFACRVLEESSYGF